MPSDYYEITTAPVSDPVSLSEAKAYCKITHSAEDIVISGLIKTAVSRLESYTNRVFMPRTIKGYFSGLACSRYEKGPFIEIRRAPLIEVLTLKIGDVDVNTDFYESRADSGFSRIVFSQVPEYSGNDVYPVVVTFTAGYAVIPETIKTAVKQYVCFMFSNRGDCGGAIPAAIKNSVSEYRIVNTFG